ncbi:MAG: hypothetical protein IPF66_07870 [Holophagales bacterium]|nr:hypothetical protein [Holophagales bacterium]
MRLGEFLMEKGLLTAEQVGAVLEAQNRTNVWFGTLALVLDYLDFDQIAEVVAEQRRAGGRFGEAAVRLGLLVPVQVERIVALQEKKHVRFGEVAVAMQQIRRKDLAPLLEEFVARREAEPGVS